MSSKYRMPRVWLAFVRLPGQKDKARVILASATNRNDAGARLQRIVHQYWQGKRGYTGASYDAAASLRQARVRVLA